VIVGVTDGVIVGVTVGDSVIVGVNVSDGVIVGVGVGDEVIVGVGVGDGVNVGVGVGICSTPIRDAGDLIPVLYFKCITVFIRDNSFYYL